MTYSKTSVKSWTPLSLLLMSELGAILLTLPFLSPLMHKGGQVPETKCPGPSEPYLHFHLLLEVIHHYSVLSLNLSSLPLSCLQGGGWQTGLARNKDGYRWLPPVSLWVPALSCCTPSMCLLYTASPLGRGSFKKKIIYFPLWSDGFCLIFNFSTFIPLHS